MKSFYGVDFNEQKELLLKSDTAKPFVNDVILKADEALEKIYPALRISDYRLFFETNDRTFFEKQYFERRNNCSYIATALYLTDDKKYIKPLMDHIFYICDEFTWCIPAHSAMDDISIERVVDRVDLMQSETARLLTDVAVLAGDKLPQFVTERIEYEIRRRIFSGFKNVSAFGFEQVTNNWAAVCAGGSGAALLHFGTEREIENILPRLISAMDMYIEGFLDDGCCIEGALYWYYGFWYFAVFAKMLYEYYEGKINYFNKEKVKRIALFPMAVRLTDSKQVSFSDGTDRFCFSPALWSFLKGLYPEVKLPELKLANTGVNVYSAIELLWFDPFYKPDERESGFVYFDKAQWYIKRNKKFSFAAKGGSNGDSHNHNDIGSFMIAVGDSVPLADIGSGIYDAKTFDDRYRYTILNNGSQGHSVPIVDGKYQCFGEKYRAENVNAGEDFFSLDIEGAYESGLIKRINRNFQIQEDGVCICDKYEFFEKPFDITERFVSFDKPCVCEGVVDFGTAELIFDKDKFRADVTEDAYPSKDNRRVYLTDIASLDESNEFYFEIRIK